MAVGDGVKVGRGFDRFEGGVDTGLDMREGDSGGIDDEYFHLFSVTRKKG